MQSVTNRTDVFHVCLSPNCGQLSSIENLDKLLFEYYVSMLSATFCFESAIEVIAIGRSRKQGGKVNEKPKDAHQSKRGIGHNCNWSGSSSCQRRGHSKYRGVSD